MKYRGIIRNDYTAAPGVSVTLFVQGCPFHCKGCHNPETWSFEDGKEFTDEVLNEVLEALSANGVDRTFCLMGGEPLCEQNLELSYRVVSAVKVRYPNKLIYIWTGYTLEQLLERNDPLTHSILSLANVLVDGPYIEEQRDITLPLRGSKNQRILNLKQIIC